MIDRKEAMAVIAKCRTDEVVISTMRAISDWQRLSESALDLFISRAMGHASSVGLGLALAQPKRKILVLDGDGSLLMNLSTLVTIASQAPPNLIHVLVENRLYEIPGAIPLPKGDYAFAEFARAAGWQKVYEFDDIESFKEAWPRLLRQTGPCFVALKVEPGPKEPYPSFDDRSMVEALEETLRRSQTPNLSKTTSSRLGVGTKPGRE